MQYTKMPPLFFPRMYVQAKYCMSKMEFNKTAINWLPTHLQKNKHGLDKEMLSLIKWITLLSNSDLKGWHSCHTLIQYKSFTFKFSTLFCLTICLHRVIYRKISLHGLIYGNNSLKHSLLKLHNKTRVITKCYWS